MISVRRCNRCGDLFDVDKNNLSSICPKCLERDAIESEYRARQDFWGDSTQSDADKYFAPRWSGSLSFIERDGEVPPDDFMEKNWIDLSQKPQRSIQKNEKKKMTASWLHF